MTTNQIAYYKAKEEERHNKEVERETQRANLAKERLEKSGQDITKVHYGHQDAEQTRSNRAQEQLKYTAIGLDANTLNEKIRSDMANEEIARANATSNRIKANSGAYLDYATAGLRFSDTALNDVKASQLIAQNQLIGAQTATEKARYYDTLAHVGVNKAQRELTTMQADMLPIQTGAQAIGSIGGLLGGASHYFTETETSRGLDLSRDYSLTTGNGGRNYVQVKRS